MRLKPKWINNQFVRDSSKLLSANTLGMIVSIAVYPLLSRIYTTAEFGTFTLFMSIGGVLLIFTSLDYHNAIVLPKEERQAKGLMQLGMFLTVIMSVLVLIASLFKGEINRLFESEEIGGYFPWLALFIFISGFWQSYNYWHTRKKNFSEIASYQLSQNVAGMGSKYLFGVAGITSGGLIWGTIVGQFIALLISSWKHFKHDLQFVFKIDWLTIRQVAIKYRFFPTYSFPRNLMNTISSNLPILLLASYFSASEIGLFSIGMSLAIRPINLVAASLHQVFYQKSAEYIQRQESIKRFFGTWVRNSLVLGTLVATPLYFCLPWLCEIFLGNGWRMSGVYIQYLLPWLLLAAIASPISYLPNLFFKQKGSLILDAICLVARLGALSIGIYANSFAIAILMYSIVGFVINAITLIWYNQLVKAYERKLNAQMLID